MVQEAHRGCAQSGCGTRAGWRARGCSLSGGRVKGCCCVTCSASVSGDTSLNNVRVRKKNGKRTGAAGGRTPHATVREGPGALAAPLHRDIYCTAEGEGCLDGGAARPVVRTLRAEESGHSRGQARWPVCLCAMARAREREHQGAHRCCPTVCGIAVGLPSPPARAGGGEPDCPLGIEETRIEKQPKSQTID